MSKVSVQLFFRSGSNGVRTGFNNKGATADSGCRAEGLDFRFFVFTVQGPVG